MTDFYTLRRRFWEHPLFNRDEPFSEPIAWLWLVEQSQTEGISTPGQFTVTLRGLAAIWHWPKSRVSRFLARLKNEGVIDAQLLRRGRRAATTISILKYPGVVIDDISPAPLPERGANVIPFPSGARDR